MSKRAYLVHSIVVIDDGGDASYGPEDAATYLACLHNKLEPGDKLEDLRVYELVPVEGREGL